jgi:6,7-dimethyl-8-ribityllumazine synthase
MAKAPHILLVEARFREDIAYELFRDAEKVLLDAGINSDGVGLKHERGA